MFDDKTFEKLMDEALAEGEALGVDTRQGGIYYDAVSGVILKVAKLYTDLSIAFDLVFRDTASNEYLDRHAQEEGMARNPAIGSWYKAVFEGTTPTPGERFFIDDGYYFSLVQKDGALYFVSETPGTITNYISPGTNAVPEKTIRGLTSATFGKIYISGSDTESDNSLRTRLRQKVAGSAENGNRQHYKTWCESVGAGRARILPLWNGPNTVKGILLDTEGQPAPPGLVEKVQEAVDPGGAGLGEGLANLGAHFTAEAAEAVSINVTFVATLTGGATAEGAKSEARVAITAYLKSLALDTPEDEAVVVRVSSIGAMLYGLPSILDYADLKINSQGANVEIQNTQVAVTGEVTVNVIV